MILPLPALYVVLALTASLAEPRSARAAFVGLVPAALSIAAYAVTPGATSPGAIAEAARASGSAFYGINAGLLLLGILLPTGAALARLREGDRSPRLLGLLALCLLAQGLVGRLVVAGGVALSLAVALGLGLAGALGGAAILRLPLPRSGPEARFAWPGVPANLRAALGFGLGGLAVIAGPRVGVVFAGLFLAAVAGYLAERSAGGRRRPWLLLVLVTLAPVWWLMVTIAGPVGLGIGTLGDVPFSLRAEILLGLPLALVAWACLGLWPAQRLLPGGLFAVLGIALWVRVARPAVPAGLEHWRPVLIPLAVLSLWGDALGRRNAGVPAALAFMALASDAPLGAVAALVLSAAGLAHASSARSKGRPSRLIVRLAWTLTVLVLPMVFEAGLRVQVTYTLAGAAGVALTLWRGLADGHGTDLSGPARELPKPAELERAA